jgi:effector-binding domain-containing protein
VPDRRTFAQGTAPVAPTQPDATQGDAFGQEVMLTAKTIVFMSGSATWDAAFETLVDALKSVQGFLEKQGIKPDGPAVTIYTEASGEGFQFQAGVPVAEEPKDPPRGDIAVGKSPAGRALQFIHHGSYDAMDTTYEAIANYLDEKKLEAKDLFVEQYLTDPTTTAEDKLVIEVLVPIK